MKEPLSSSGGIAVVIPSYRVIAHVLDVLEKIPRLVDRIFVVDDACPEGSGEHVRKHCADPRVRVIVHEKNQGVGGAVMSGYRAAVAEGFAIVVKIDGDGQMNPALIPAFVAPLWAGEADYAKGNRFFDLDGVRQMPKIRLFGNAVLSLMTKISSGYWNLFDPTNGYTAIHIEALRRLPLEKISQRYFFESDMLFQLNILRAVVVDVPMEARYADEKSNLKIPRIIGEFLYKHGRNALKRIFYNYYLRDMSLASIELPLGVLLLGFGVVFGAYHWALSALSEIPALTGAVMLAALPVIIGIQFILAFLAHDIAALPDRPLSRTKTGITL